MPNRDPERTLTPGERRRLSPGLVRALDAAGCRPRLLDRVHPAARIAALWRERPPILTRGDRIFWPGAPADASGPFAESAMALLQHELQHVLDYRTGALTAAGYLLRPRNWTYRVRILRGKPFAAYGAEQRAVLAEALWRLETGSGLSPEARRKRDVLRALIPWAAPTSSDGDPARRATPAAAKSG